MAARWMTRTVLLLGAMMILAPMALSGSARAVSVPDAVRAAVADALESDNETGGYAAGILAIIVILIIVSLIMVKTQNDNPMFLGVASMAGIGFVLLVGWWPAWTAIFIAFGFILMIMGRKGDSA